MDADTSNNKRTSTTQSSIKTRHPWHRALTTLAGALLFAASHLNCALADDNSPGPARERFIPADQLDAVFERSPQGVMLPRDEFNDLLAKAQLAQKQLANTPAAIVLRSAVYDVEQSDNHALIQLSVNIEQFTDGWVTLHIPVGNMQVEEATIDDRPAAIGRDAKQTDTLILVNNRTGKFTLNLKLSTPLGTVGSDRVAAFQSITNASSQANIACPKSQYLEITDLKLKRPDAVDQPTTYSVPIGGSDTISLKWTTRQQQSETQTLVFARTDAHVQLNSDSMRWNSDTRLSVFGNSINQVTCRVPDRVEVTAVDSTGLESWKLEDDPNQKGFTRLILNYRQPFTEDRVVKISAVATLPATANSKLPTLEFIDVTSHTGRIYVDHEDQLRLMAEVGGGIRHLGTAPQSGPQHGGEIFDFWLQAYELSVAVKSRDRELFAEINSTLSIIDTSASFTCEATIEALNAPLFELALQLPDDWQIATVTDDAGKPLKWRSANESGRIAIEPVTPVAAGGLLIFKVEFTRTIKDPTSPQQFPLPVLTAVDTLLVGGTYRITSANDLTVAPQEILGLSAIGDNTGTLLFETQGTMYSGQLSVVRKPARLSSRSVLKAWMDSRQKNVEAVITVDVINGTTRTLELLLPEDLGSDVRFSVLSLGPVPGVTGQQVPDGVVISEQTPGKVTDGQRNYRLTFNKRFVGALTLKTTVQQPRVDDTKLTAPAVTVVGAIRQHGLIAFEAYPEQQLTAPDIATSRLTIADSGLVEAPPETSGRRTALVYRFVRPDYSLELTEHRFETEAVPSAVCESIANISVLSDNGTIQRSCTVQLRSVGVQTLRFALPDPENSYLWSTILDDEAVEVRRDGDQYLVAIPTGTDRTEHVLEVLFESSSRKIGMLGHTTQQSLQLGIDIEQGSNATIDILQQTWDVRYPSSSMLVNHGGGFHPQSDVEQPGWIQSITSLAELPSAREAFERAVPLVVVILGLFVLTVLILRRRWRSLLCVCVLALIAGPLTLSSTGTRQYGGDFSTDNMVAATAVQMSEPAAENWEFGGGAFDGNYESPDSPEGMGMGGALNVPQAAAPMDAITEIQRYDQKQQTVPLLNRIPESPGRRQSGGVNMATDLEDFGGGSGAFAGGVAMTDPFAQPTPNNFSDTINQPPPPNAILFEQAPIESDFSAPSPPQEFAAKPSKPTGAARLSIRAHVAEPDDYRTMQFRSIGSTTEAGTLDVVVQQRSHAGALRMISAAVILLFCLWMKSASTTTRLCFAVFCLMTAAGAAALVANQWQSAVDGVVIGALLGMGIWLCAAACCCCRMCCSLIRNCSCWTSLKKRQATTAAMIFVLAAVTFAPTGLHAQSNDPTINRPDVILPYSPGRPELLAERVFLPRDEFLKLYNQAYPDQQQNGSPNASLVVAAFYNSTELKQIKGSEWSQSFTARYVIRSFSSDNTTVRLPISDVAIRSATLNDSTAILKAQATTAVPQVQQTPNQQVQQIAVPPAQAQQSYDVLVPSAGMHLLDVVFDRSVTLENSVGKLVLPLQTVAAGTLVFELPEDSLDVKVNGRSNTFRQKGRTLTIPVSESTGTRIEWRPRSIQTSSDTIFHSMVNSALIVSDAGLTVQSSVKIHCRQGQLAEVEITFPKDYAVQSVDGADVAGWSITKSASPSLAVQFQAPVDSDTSIHFTLFRQQILNSTESILDVPVPAVLGASRDSGHVTVAAGDELEVRVDSLSGVSQLNVADTQLPDGIDQTLPRVLAWRYTRHPAAVSIRASRTSERLKITVLNGVQLEPQRQLWTTLISAHISGAPRRRLEVHVPKDFLALDVNANDLADWYYTEDSDPDSNTKTLNIQFTTARLGTVNATIQGQTGRQNEASATLRAPEVATADEAVTYVSVWLDAASEIVTADAAGWKRIGTDAQIDSRIRALKPSAPDISFSSRAAQKAIVLTLRQAPASYIAESVTVSNVTDTAINLTLGLNWQISGAATRELSFIVSKEMNDVLDFKVPGLRQLQKTVVDKGIQVTLNLQQPVSENFFVLGTGTLPLPESRQITAPPTSFNVSANSKANIASQSHFWVIVNQSEGVLEAVDQNSDGNDVDADEIKTKIPDGFLQQSVAIRRLRADRNQSAWQLKFPERQQIAPAVVALAAHTTIIAADGTWRSRHDLQVRNESRQFLPIILPEESRILYCLVKDKPTRIVSRPDGQQTLYLIPVPQSGEIATPFEVQFALTGRLPQVPKNLAGEAIAIPAPTFPEYRDFPEYGITVARNTWSVHLPTTWQASLLQDPRQSNVVNAGDGDFQDVMLLACVDNTKSMLNSLLSSKRSIEQSGQGLEFYTELNRQKGLLQGQLGNNPLAEDERTQALQQIELLLGEQSQIFGPGTDRDAGYQINGIVTGQPSSSGNRYLEMQELTSNSLNTINNDALFFSNGGLGVQANSEPELAGKSAADSKNLMPNSFGFALPKSNAAAPATDKLLIRNGETLGRKSATKAETKPSNERGSQLLNRRQFNIEQQQDAASGQIQNSTSRELIDNNAPAQTELRHQATNGDQNPFAGHEALAAEGLLSLSFQIPEDGLQHDFVRTGGNASLTLNVRSRNSVHWALGVVWAVGCLIGALLLFKGACSGSVSMLQRLCIVSAVAALLGWLCFPNPIRSLAFVLCVAASISYCLILIGNSFRKPTTA